MGKVHWLAQGLRQSSVQVEPSVVMTTQNFKRKAKKKKKKSLPLAVLFPPAAWRFTESDTTEVT